MLKGNLSLKIKIIPIQPLANPAVFLTIPSFAPPIFLMYIFVVAAEMSALPIHDDNILFVIICEQ